MRSSMPAWYNPFSSSDSCMRYRTLVLTGDSSYISGNMSSPFHAPINVKPAEGRRQGIGRDFDRSLWPGGRAFESSRCPVGRDIWIFVRARDHKSFLRVGNLVIFDLTFLPGGGEFYSNLLENVKIPPYAPPPPRRLDIDRCIINSFVYRKCSSRISQ